MKSMIIVVILFLSISAAWAGKFLETFDNKNLKVWTELTMYVSDLAADIPTGSWEILDGELQATVKDRLPRLLTIGDKTWQDYEIEFDVKPEVVICHRSWGRQRIRVLSVPERHLNRNWLQPL